MVGLGRRRRARVRMLTASRRRAEIPSKLPLRQDHNCRNAGLSSASVHLLSHRPRWFSRGSVCATALAPTPAPAPALTGCWLRNLCLDLTTLGINSAHQVLLLKTCDRPTPKSSSSKSPPRPLGLIFAQICNNHGRRPIPTPEPLHAPGSCSPTNSSARPSPTCGRRRAWKAKAGSLDLRRKGLSLNP